MGKSFCHVPEEVVEEIFSWLPPESLIRFKCVCKSWCSLITSLFNDPVFVAKHLHNAHNNILSPKSLLIIDHDPEEEEDISSDDDDDILLLNISSDNGEKDDIHFVIEELEVQSPFDRRYLSNREFTRMMGGHIRHVKFYHCDGIICLIFGDETMLWNPSLRESKLLPPPKSAYKFDICGQVGITGFGYDPVANDYKVVKIFPNKLYEIYSLNTSTWKDITKGSDEDEYEYSIEGAMQVCYKGLCYWFLYFNKNMLSFDLHTEEFRVIPLPDPASIWKRTLKVWIDSIAFIASCENGIEIWVMNYCSDGVSDSFFWIKHLRIVPDVATPLIFWKSDELLLKCMSGFVSCNLRSKKLRKLIDQGVDRSLKLWGAYVKSLISINRQG